ncbi:hypothetical protein L9F63_008362, partial [Diploptera punctata]
NNEGPAFGQYYYGWNYFDLNYNIRKNGKKAKGGGNVTRIESIAYIGVVMWDTVNIVF